MVFAPAPLLAAATADSRAAIDERIAAEERRKQDLERKLQTYRQAIQQLNVRENDTIARIDRYQQDTERARQEIAILELQVNKIQKNITELDAETRKIETQMDEMRARLRRRVVAMAKYGMSETLQVIMSAVNTHEMLDSVHILDKLSQYDQYLIEQLQSKQWEIDLSRKTMENHRDSLKNRSQALGAERQKFTASIKETNTFLSNLRRQKAEAERAAREMEEAQRAVGQTILNLVNQKKNREAEAQKSDPGKKQPPRADYLGSRIAQGRGSMFDWPVRGPISSAFGPRVHPVFKTKSFHSGIDIASTRGTPVKAAAPGEVLFVGWMRGYGQVVIIDHGRDYSTVYAHMSATSVREGAVVKAGSVVGAVGDTGTTTGFHLHFEVRVGSAAKSPLDYLKK
ncbi:peptidase M23 [Synergistales bacterium]|nr:peptidase M23 [Synergistales bacterium]